MKEVIEIVKKIQLRFFKSISVQYDFHILNNFIYVGTKGDSDFPISDKVKNPDGTDI